VARNTKALTIVLSALAIGLLLLGVSACTRTVVKEVPKEVIKEVPKEVIKEVPKEVVKEVVKEVPLNLAQVADKIQKGQIDVGKNSGMDVTQRYHKIHAEVVGVTCNTCHTKATTTQDEVFAVQDVSPTSPGMVDQKLCLGCHQTGPARNLYGSP